MILWGVVWGSQVFLGMPEPCGKHPMDLQMERGVCSESTMDSDKGLKSCTVKREGGYAAGSIAGGIKLFWWSLTHYLRSLEL